VREWIKSVDPCDYNFLAIKLFKLREDLERTFEDVRFKAHHTSSIRFLLLTELDEAPLYLAIHRLLGPNTCCFTLTLV